MNKPKTKTQNPKPKTITITKTMNSTFSKLITNVVFEFKTHHYQDEDGVPISNTDINEFELECGKNKIRVYAEADCCSESWIEWLPNTNIMDCIGKTYICCEEVCLEDIDLPNLPKSHRQEYDSNHLFEIQFTDGTTFPFYMRNASNGYYDGNIVVSFEPFMKDVLQLQEYNKGQIIIIVGLPGSGKSTYAKSMEEEQIEDTCICHLDIFDDTELFLDSTLYTLKQSLNQGQTIIVVSAKLCEPTKYKQFINSLNILNPEQAIETHCFTNDVQNSTQNIQAREYNQFNETNKLNKLNKTKAIQRMTSLMTSLMTLTTVYDPNTDVYINKRIIPTYQKP